MYRSHQLQYLQIIKKSNVRSVHRVYQGRLDRAVEWVSAHVTAVRCSPKYKQQADEQLSSSVNMFRCTNSLRLPLRKKKCNSVDLIIVTAIEMELYIRSSCWSMPYQPNHIQKITEIRQTIMHHLSVNIIYSIFLSTMNRTGTIWRSLDVLS
ncbi:hypothetical protein TNCV_4364311 [Trichonephila clavipes]|nr:hypothetical protein TNCV_4364311 [Trichonephila clavipes]